MRGAGAHRLGRHRGGHRRAHQHRHAADLEVRHRGAEAALPRAGDPRREDRRARHHRAGRRLGRRGAAHRAPSASTAAGCVNGEKTYITNGVRAHFIVTAVKTTRRGRPPRDLVPDRRPRRGRQPRPSSRSSAGTPPTPPRSPSRTCSCRRRTCSATLHEGFKLIMANFQWERLAMALGAVGAMRIAWERTAEFARERHAFGRPLSGHQAIRHKLADLATSALHVPLRHLRRAAPLRRRRGTAAGGHDGQAADPARVASS